MAKKNKSDNDIREIDNKYELLAYLFKYRLKEFLAVLFSIALILNLADVKISDLIKKVVDMVF